FAAAFVFSASAFFWRPQMRFLCLFTGDNAGPPSPEHMQRMGAYMDKSKAEGKLIATGGLKKREADGFVVRKKGDDYSVTNGGAPWAAASGWAILEAGSREEVIEDVKTFLGLAGDGVSEVIEVFQAV